MTAATKQKVGFAQSQKHTVLLQSTDFQSFRNTEEPIVIRKTLKTGIVIVASDGI